MIDRRTFLAGTGAVLLAAPLAAEAQQARKLYRIGVLASQAGPAIDLLRQGLRDLGYEEGRNLVIEFRWYGGNLDRLPALAAELVSLKLDVITVATPQAALAVKAATTTIPVVFLFVADPVSLGLVSSLAHPGGNVTGLSTLVPGGFMGKNFGLLKEAVPGAVRLAALVNPDNAMQQMFLPQTVAAAEKLKVKLQILEARTLGELESAFEAATRARVDAIQVYSDALILAHRVRIAELAAKARLPTMFLFKDNVVAGGLMSYGPVTADMWRRAATYVNKILKGAKPGDLPVEQPTKFELVINLKTAKALGLTIPPSVLGRADEVIQ